jgi:hypothetical protein
MDLQVTRFSQQRKGSHEIPIVTVGQLLFVLDSSQLGCLDIARPV